MVTLGNERTQRLVPHVSHAAITSPSSKKMTLNLFSILTGQKYCQHTDGCKQPADCLPPISNVTCPTVWEYLQLGDALSKGVFEQGDVAVALRSLEKHGVNGSLEFYSNSKWTAVNALTATTALVLGKTSYLR